MEPSISPTTPPTAAHGDVEAFLRSVYPADLFDATPSTRRRPFVTLTYAQSIDGKIAGLRGAQIRLSGDESMVLTHRSVLLLPQFFFIIADD